MSTTPSLLHLTDAISIPLPEDGETVRFDEDAAQIVKDFIGLLPFGQNEWAGKPFQLLPWEIDAIDKFYGVVSQDQVDGVWGRYRQYLYIEIPKKNGKSELAAALGLYHLLADGESLPNVGVFAADKDNASIIYNAAKYMVEHSCIGQPEHDPIAWALDSRREIRTKHGGVMKVYSSDAQTKHGYSFSAVIFDELHAQPDRRLWDVVTTGSGDARRQPVYIVLTTAGDDPDRTSIGWEVHEKCRRLLNWRAGTPENETDRDDPAWCPIMYGISVLTGDDPDRISELNIYDPELWKQCNPSLGVTVKLRTVRQHARTAKQSEAQERLFRWLRLNQWVAVKSVGWIPLTIYDKTQWNGDVETLRGKTCFGGLDLSSTTDLTAFVMVFPIQPGLETAVTLWWAWLPDSNIEDRERQDHAPYRDWERAHFLTLCHGDLVDYPDVEAAILEAAQLYKLEMLGVDPYLSRTITARLNESFQSRRIKTQIVEIPQTMLGMSPAMKWIKEAMYARTLLHVHNTCARYCFGNVRWIILRKGRRRMMRTVRDLLAIARKELGNTESPAGSNRTKYGKWFGLDGQPWCMMFIMWVFAQLGVKLPARTASCGELMRAAQAAGCWVVRDFQPGDVVIYDFSGRQKTTQHCGIVEIILPDYGVQAIEGNTSQFGSQDNGGMVCRKNRASKYIIGAVRPKFDEEKKEEDDMTIAEIISGMTDKQAYELLEKAKRHAATLPEPDWSKKEGHWARAEARKVLSGNPEGLVKRDELAAVLGRLGKLD